MFDVVPEVRSRIQLQLSEKRFRLAYICKVTWLETSSPSTRYQSITRIHIRVQNDSTNGSGTATTPLTRGTYR